MLTMTDTASRWRTGMVKWLETRAVGPDGVVWSWVNPHHPGYAYPEIAGYLLCFFTQEGTDCSLQHQIARRLCDDLARSGAVGRDGLFYLFDSAMALTGLLAHGGRCGLEAREKRVIQHAFEVLTARILERNAVWSNNGPSSLERRWSMEFGPHLLKLSLALHGAKEHLGRSEGSTVFRRLLEDLLPRFADGRFRAFGDTSDCNLHAHCYALDGLLVSDLAGGIGGDMRHHLFAGADWLAKVQNEFGGLPEWHDGRIGWGPLRADVAAQALRLWIFLDRSRYRDQIDRSLKFLRRLQDSSGGLRFTPESSDVNTWATIFAAQAVGCLQELKPLNII